MFTLEDIVNTGDLEELFNRVSHGQRVQKSSNLDLLRAIRNFCPISTDDIDPYLEDKSVLVELEKYVLAYFMYSYATTMGVDYTGLDIGLKSKSKGKSIDCSKRCILQVDTENFSISKQLSENTIYNPLEIFESKNVDTNKNSLKASGLSDGIEIKGFETELDSNSINSLYAHILLKDFDFGNLVVASRDYYSEEEMKALGNIFSIRRDTNVTVIPASLAFIINCKMAIETSVDVSLVISTRGNKVAFNVYKSLKEKEKLVIENVLSEIYDEVSDNKIRDLILGNVKRQIMEHVEKLKGINSKFTFYPVLDADSEIYDNSVDLLEVYEDVKNAVLSNHVSYTIREIFVNGPTEKFPLLDISIDIQDIVKEINEILEPTKSKFENIVQNIKETILNNDLKLNSVYFITDYFSIFEGFFDLEGANKVQNGFIKVGCSMYDKNKLEIKNIKIFETTVYIENDCKKVLDEIKYKKDAKNIVNNIKEKGGLSEILVNLKNEDFAELEKTISNNNFFDLKTSKVIVNDYKLLVRKDIKVGKGRKEREENKKTLEKVLSNALKIEKSEPELWESGLDKRIEPIKKWFEEAKVDENILGYEFEAKANLLEGYVQAFKNKIIRKKQEEEKQKQEEEKRKQEEEKKNEEEKKKNEDKTQIDHENNENQQVDENKQSEKAPEVNEEALNKEGNTQEEAINKEEFTEEEVEEAKKLLENNQEIPDMNNFDYEAFQKKLDELMKDDKYKKLFDKEKAKEEGNLKNENPDLESREL